MAEAEDVLVDAARHATVFARRLWAAHGPRPRADVVELAPVAERLAILVQAVFGLHAPLRVAQPPAPSTLLTRVFRGRSLPRHTAAIPATDGADIWLPARLVGSGGLGLRDYRCMVLLQAARAARGAPGLLGEAAGRGLADFYLLAEAAAGERLLRAVLPGMAGELAAFRAARLAARPRIESFHEARRPLEELARRLLRGELPEAGLAREDWTPRESLALAGRWAEGLQSTDLFRDLWTGELRPGAQVSLTARPLAGDTEPARPPRSARLARRPDVRQARDDEDDERAGAWMIQSAQPAETAEDPFGMQRPTDQDQDATADEYADSVSELGEARLVSTPERAREILVSDDPPEAVTRRELARECAETALHYPEWDYQLGKYRHPGARVRLQPAASGSPDWVAATLRAHRTMADEIRRRFEMLRAERLRTRRQPEGDEIDLEAYVEARADFCAGLPLAQGVYQSSRLTRRDLVITLLIDVSGSTDSWISQGRRVIDVERDALLLVCHALQALREPYNVLAFSGQGPENVVMREVKAFDEPFGDAVARRIAALEPEHYTRAGAALRHATALLVKRTARHRLLLLLSDGKPNDDDEYDGRYGAEDMRQSVAEARLQGVYPFCLTIDRQAAGYLPRVFGVGHYAVLHEPERLPVVLLEWMRRLLAAR